MQLVWGVEVSVCFRRRRSCLVWSDVIKVKKYITSSKIYCSKEQKGTGEVAYHALKARYVVSAATGLSIKTRHEQCGIMVVAVFIVRQPPLLMKVYLRDSNRNVHEQGRVWKFLVKLIFFIKFTDFPPLSDWSSGFLEVLLEVGDRRLNDTHITLNHSYTVTLVRMLIIYAHNKRSSLIRGVNALILHMISLVTSYFHLLMTSWIVPPLEQPQHMKPELLKSCSSAPAGFCPHATALGSDLFDCFHIFFSFLSAVFGWSTAQSQHTPTPLMFLLSQSSLVKGHKVNANSKEGQAWTQHMPWTTYNRAATQKLRRVRYLYWTKGQNCVLLSKRIGTCVLSSWH